MSAANPSVPASVSIGLICLLLGAGGGVLAMQYHGPFDFSGKKPEEKAEGAEDKAPGPPMAAGMGGGEAKGKGKGKGKGGGGKGGGMGKGGPGGGGGPATGGPKNQLTSLVTKLDVLTAKPLTITLSDEQKAKLAEQLAGLEGMDDLSEDEAQKRVKAILDIVQGDRATLEAAGFIWPGSGPDTRFGMTSPNPFSRVEEGKRLKSLLERTSKPKG